MDFLDAIPVVGPVLGVAVPFLIVLAVVVFVHEYGHYIVGRWCGIHAETFSIGFGRTLFAWTDKRGTKWQVAAVPLGGFVKFVGDMNPASVGTPDDDTLSEEQRAVAFHSAPLAARAATVAAGPVANFLLSIGLFAGIVLSVGLPTDEPVIAEVADYSRAEIGLETGDRVLAIEGEPVEGFVDMLNRLHRTEGETVSVLVERGGQEVEIPVSYSLPPRVDSILPGDPAAQAGILPGDLIREINGQRIHSFFAVQKLAAELGAGDGMSVVIERNGEMRTFEVMPVMRSRAHPDTGETVPQATIGITASSTHGLGAPRRSAGVLEAVEIGALNTWAVISGTVLYLGDMIFADADTSQIGGPLQIAKMSGETAEEGMLAFLRLIALLSTSIGLLNLLPIPVLDGGHLMFYAAEAVRGRPLRESWMQIGTVIGLSLVLSLMVFATYNDISRLFAG